ncbi:hypothetical protein [uncultured Corynebacterium sp.]|uniref:hypothetical protein n=1 Tax=uncultured Corynebacterium sp. TaxID=159447 RepID=UPI0025D83103|nr:hypothetical protein [uncultured Corynebacterium sp.]
MKFHRSLTATLIAGATALSLAACGDDGNGTEESTSTETTTTSEVAAFPTAMELNDILARATDPNVPVEEKVLTVENGEEATELFDVMTRSKQESGATLEVVEPVLPGYSPDAVLAGVNFILPEQEPHLIEGVEFRNIDGHWKLSQTWACTLVQNVAPDQVPPSCLPEGAPPAEPAPEGDPAAPDAPPAEPAPPAPEAPPAPPAEPAPPAPEAPPAPPAEPAPPAPEAPAAPPA